MSESRSGVKSERVPRAAGTVSLHTHTRHAKSRIQTPCIHPPPFSLITTPRTLTHGPHAFSIGRRRKIKCEYSSSGSETCVPCGARSVTCISQEYDDADLKTPPVDRRLGQRLSRLEQMMETLANGYPPPESTSGCGGGGGGGGGGDSSETGGGSAGGGSGGTLGYKQTDLLAVEDDLLDSAVKNAQDVAIGYTNPVDQGSNLPTPGSSTASTGPGGAASAGNGTTNPYQVSAQLRTQRHKQVSEYLYSLLPPLDIRHLLAHDTPGAETALRIFYSHTDQLAGRHEQPDALCSASSPTASSHPALLAKRLLQLCLCIQHLPPNFDISRLRMGRKQPCEAVSLWTGAAALLVANDNDLLGCVEGLECLQLLAMFQADSGHLRKSWMTTRRALGMAQLLGLGRPNPSPVRSCAPGGNQASLPVIWFRINCMDRYQSLILGLPIGSASNAFALRHLDTDDDVDRSGKAYSVIAGRIADRNDILSSTSSESEIAQAYALTQSIDLDLERAARLMEDSWWAMADLSEALRMTTTDKGKSFLAGTVKNRLQVRHFTLLILLHLPYLLKERQEKRYVYSRTTAVNASRAILDRFLEFRTVFIGTINGRHVDYSALMASMALCLGYLGSGRDENERRQDRAKVEKTQAKFHEMSLAKNDRLAKESSETIKELLPIMQQDGAAGTKDGQNVHVTVPFLGTVNIGPQSNPSLAASTTAPNNNVIMPDLPFSSALVPNVLVSPYLEPDASTWGAETQPSINGHEEFTDAPWGNFSADLESWAFQGIDTTFWTMLNQNTNL